MSFEPIGFLESCYPDKFGTPRQPGLAQHSWARLRFHPRVQPQESLQGIEEFSHLWLLFLFHKNTNERFHAKVRPPRLGGETRGVFATRSPHRPNPIGLSLVRLERVDHHELILSGIDLIDGTPILDVKPYLPSIESRPEAQEGWVQEAPPSQISIEWSEDQLGHLHKWEQQLCRDATLREGQLKPLIEETLRLDPRPLVYRGYEGLESPPYRSTHAVRFFDGDVHFDYPTPDRIRILKVLTGVSSRV